MKQITAFRLKLFNHLFGACQGLKIKMVTNFSAASRQPDF